MALFQQTEPNLRPDHSLASPHVCLSGKSDLERHRAVLNKLQVEFWLGGEEFHGSAADIQTLIVVHESS